MVADFAIVLFTPENPNPDEALIINDLLEMGAVDFVHLRHPSLDEDGHRDILDKINPEVRRCIRLHDHFNLIEEYGLRGAHLNRRNPEYDGPRFSSTCSCHTFDELIQSVGLEYCTLSPIFSSISKEDYNPKFSLNEASKHIRGKKVIALGGVKPSDFDKLRTCGFAGAALLGAFWQNEDKMKVARQMKMFRNDRFALQYITNGTTPDQVEQEVRNVLAGGCRWVQVRMKEAEDMLIESAITRVKPLCQEASAILLVDDKVEIAKRMSLDGVHLGREDMAPSLARSILGEKTIIGSTANNLEQVKALDFDNIDYAGVGPLRFTTTKKKLAPVLGIKGYSEIFAGMKNEPSHLPIVAIGGITASDVVSLKNVGAQGVAVSGAIFYSPDPVYATRCFL